MTFRFVILAAGMGSRMGGAIPKALIPVGGKPILQWLYESTKASGVDGIPIIVVGHERDQLCQSFNGLCEYVVQEQQLGTGHAVMMAKQAARGSDAIIVLYGDHPFISPVSLRRLSEQHMNQQNTITMMTVTVPSFEGWRKVFAHWGRILRNDQGEILGIREYKDTSEGERQLLEVNPAFFCFKADWLWENLKKLKNDNKQKEYYLTDLIAMAVTQQEKIATMSIASEEAIGINTPEEREIAEEILHQQKQPE